MLKISITPFTNGSDSIFHEFDKVSDERGYKASGDYSFFYKNVSVSSRKELEDIMKFDVIH